VNEQYRDLHFPRSGLDVSAAFGSQPNRPSVRGEYARTAPVGNNVRAFEPTGFRSRGGSRPGLTRWSPARVSGSHWVVQELAVLSSTSHAQPSGTVPQYSQSGRVVTLVAVSEGDVFTAGPTDTVWTGAINATGEDPALNVTGVLYSSVVNQLMFFADGTNWVYYDPQTNTLHPWVATRGTLPVDGFNNTPRLICTWRGRIVLSGVLYDPNVVFMSAVTDPFDFEYFPADPAVTDAVALNAESNLGAVGDVVTCLIPYSDDVLIIGCDHSVYLLRGDPNDGGQLDLVTDSIGMVFGQPWCRDPAGNVWFFSNRTGVFRFTPGQQPVRVSQQIEPLLQEVNTGDYGIRLLWDDRFQGLHVFVTYLIDPRATTHYFFEARANAWWTDTFRNPDHNPLCCCVLDGNRPDDRVALLGCWDGYVRYVQRDAVKDDGYLIDSEVVIGPLLTKDMDELLVKELQPVLGEESGDVTYEVYVGNTAQAALVSEPVASGTWTSGRNVVSSVRRSGHAIYLKLSSTNRWAMEQVRALVASQGKVRRRGR
jgi:hypothetical protein